MATHTVTLGVDVQDRRRLMLAAAARAASQGMARRDWFAVRREHGDPVQADLIMLLDRSSDDTGIEIDWSDAGEIEPIGYGITL